MGDQSLYKANHVVNCTESSYYQLPPTSVAAGAGGLNHSYGSTVMETPQASPVSSAFPHDTGKNYPELIETTKTGGSWPSAGNHLRNSLGNAGVMWAASSQGEALPAAEGAPYQYSCTQQAEGPAKLDPAVQKLDSFTQVFASQNLRILQGAGGGGLLAHAQPLGTSLADATTDSALRQLLSQKPQVLESAPSQLKFQQQQTFDDGQAKAQAMHELQHHHHHHHHHPHPHQQLYYEYQQQQQQQHQQHQQRAAQLQQLQHVLQQRQQQMLQQQQQQQQQAQQQSQQQFYLQQTQTTTAQQQQQQQTTLSGHALLQQLQQQQQQRHAYYQQQANLLQLQQQQMHAPTPAVPFHQSRKGAGQAYGPQEQGHVGQHVQMSPAQSQYFYQEQPPQYCHVYQQSVHLQQAQQQAQQTPVQEELHSPTKHFQAESSCATVVSEVRDSSLNQKGTHPPMSAPSQTGQRALGELLPTVQLVSIKAEIQEEQQPQQPPAGTLWSQVMLNDMKPEATSPDDSTLASPTFLDRTEVKSKLVCAICLKEFKSLPALNGHMRSHGGMRASPSLKPEDGDKQLPKEVDAHLPIVMPVSVPVKLLPAAAMLRQPTDASQPAADHVDRSAQLPAPPGPPCQRPLGPPHGCSDAPRKLTKAEKPDKRGQHEKKKYRHRPEPLIIPPPSLTLSMGNATLFQSQLRSPRLLGEPLPYTPPPMLSPVRQGSGLFSSVIQHSQSTKAASPITPRVYLGRSSGADGLSVSVTPGLGEQLVNIEPHINLGRQYQAEIPRLQSRSKMANDDHRASLVWTNRPEFESASGQQKVDNLVNMACSSVLPGGGTNSEYALHCLFETQGDFLATLEKLLMLKTTRQESHPLAGYHYAGSDQWTPLEKKMLKKALVIHNKDFFLVQKMVKTKTVSQCVEFYYTFKKRMHLGRKHRSRLMSADEEELLTNQNENTELDEVEEEKKSAKEEQQDTAMVDVSPDDRVTAPEEPAPVESAALTNMSSFSFPCEMPNCGAVFTSRQALNGHGRIHGGTTQQVKLVLGSKMKMGSQSDYSSVKGSPAHSTTSGDTDPTLFFPCKECGKVFFKIKSRNAHMKTHKQQDDQEHKKVLHMSAMKMPSSLSQVSRHHVMLPLDHMGLVKRQGLDEEDEDPLLSSHLLLDDDHGGYLRDEDEL